MNGIQNKYGIPFEGLIGEGVDDVVDQKIEVKMLDGSYAVQVVGDPSPFLTVVFYCSRETRRSLQLAKSHAEQVTVEWRGVMYQGWISELTFASFWPKIINRQEKLTMKILTEVAT